MINNNCALEINILLFDSGRCCTLQINNLYLMFYSKYKLIRTVLFKNVRSDLLPPGKFVTIRSHLNVMQHSTTCHLLYKEMGPIRRETIFKEENSENVLLKAGITVFSGKDITTETLFLPCSM